MFLNLRTLKAGKRQGQRSGHPFLEPWMHQCSPCAGAMPDQVQRLMTSPACADTSWFVRVIWNSKNATTLPYATLAASRWQPKKAKKPQPLLGFEGYSRLSHVSWLIFWARNISMLRLIREAAITGLLLGFHCLLLVLAIISSPFHSSSMEEIPEHSIADIRAIWSQISGSAACWILSRTSRVKVRRKWCLQDPKCSFPDRFSLADTQCRPIIPPIHRCWWPLVHLSPWGENSASQGAPCRPPARWRARGSLHRASWSHHRSRRWCRRRGQRWASVTTSHRPASHRASLTWDLSSPHRCKGCCTTTGGINLSSSSTSRRPSKLPRHVPRPLVVRRPHQHIRLYAGHTRGIVSILRTFFNAKESPLTRHRELWRHLAMEPLILLHSSFPASRPRPPDDRDSSGLQIFDSDRTATMDRVEQPASQRPMNPHHPTTIEANPQVIICRAWRLVELRRLPWRRPKRRCPNSTQARSSRGALRATVGWSGFMVPHFMLQCRFIFPCITLDRPGFMFPQTLFFFLCWSWFTVFLLHVSHRCQTFMTTHPSRQSRQANSSSGFHKLAGSILEHQSSKCNYCLSQATKPWCFIRHGKLDQT